MLKKAHDKIAARLAQIISKLNNGERFTQQELIEEFNVDIRTIQRDLHERLISLPIEKNNGYYSLASYALGKLTMRDIQNFAILSGIQSLYPALDQKFMSDLLSIKLNTSYLVKHQGFEDISNKRDIFEQISGAIVRHSPIVFQYKEKQRKVNPYKLVNNNGIWYLLADENDQLKNYTFSKIKQMEWDFQEEFTPNKAFLELIAKNDTNWFSNQTIEVILEIKQEAMEYFLRKETLPNKKILEQTPSNLILSTNVSYDDEILRIVKYWIPYIKIQSPSYLQEKLSIILQEYLKTT
ncbi:helix-turn-helix transcriptional regulator [Sulfurospirillum cavolei]|uniref:helix-turn-helix transcriptional regulator n=1 Tax=Sulfurospirillum cavolei TaxID=366522 RepID=UPI000764AEF0|nr:WYL domain-containing protein [Sulfurospirillum cavolei]